MVSYFFSKNGDSKLKDGFSFYRDNCLEWDIVMNSFSLIKPKLSFICNFASDKHKVYLISLYRKNLIDWKVVDSKTIQITNKPFSKALHLARNYDLSQTNPDPENITIYEEPDVKTTDEDKVYEKVEDFCIDKIKKEEITTSEELEKCREKAYKKFGEG
jgi:hypothetical protein